MSLSLPEFVTRWKASALSERAADDPTSPICVKSSAILILLLRASLGADLIQCEKGGELRFSDLLNNECPPGDGARLDLVPGMSRGSGQF
jgi:hypothetical protein